ncbi:IS66 family insertion sequence element accessory protein TnpB [Escherichia coli]|nr:IS66 family insertion sequence element accessory protein TnpB [Escherichia coli]
MDALQTGCVHIKYCELYDIPFKSLRQWPQDVAKAEKQARAPEIIPVSVSGAPGMADGRPLSDEPVTLFLPGGIRMCCQPSQLTDVFRALRHADA